MDLFVQTLQSWQSFFASVATASATLTGLLFVALSLNRQRLTNEGATSILSIARNSFAAFLFVLMIALVFLVPYPLPVSLTIALLVLGLANTFGVIVRELRPIRAFRFTGPDVSRLLRQFALPFVASIGLVWVAIDISQGHFDAIYGLVGVLAALLVSACWNAWLLLVG